MRLLQILLAIAVILLGMVLAALNPEPVALDLWIGRFELSVGVLVLLSMLGGVLLGGAAVLIGVIWPLRRRKAGGRPSRGDDAHRSGTQPPSP